MRFFACVDPWAGLRFSRPMTPTYLASVTTRRTLFHRHKVAHLENHAARFRRVRQLDGVPNAPQPHPLHRRLLRLVAADHALLQRDLQDLARSLLCHDALTPPPGRLL